MLATLLVLTALTPILLVFSHRCLASMFNAPPLWVPATLPYRQTYDWFAEQFANQDIVVVSWPGAHLNDAALDEFAKSLLEADRRRPETRQLFSDVLTGRSMLERLTEAPADLSHRQAMGRLRGTLIGPDNETSAAVVILTTPGGYARGEAVDVISTHAAAFANRPQDEIHIAGPPVDGLAIDRASRSSIDRLTVPSMLITAVVCWYCLRSWAFTLMILIAATVSRMLVLALVNLAGYDLNAILIAMPALVFVLAVSAGVHITNYYRDALHSESPIKATQIALQNSLLPCTLAAITTVIGLLSLCVSEIIPVRVFGIVSAVGVIACVVSLILLLPGVMESHADRAAKQTASDRREPGEPRVFRWIMPVIERFPSVIAIAFSIVVAVLLAGFFSIRTSVEISQFFSPKSKIAIDYRWLQENLGPLVAIEVILQFQPDEQADNYERLDLVKQVHHEIGSMDLVGGIMSAATFVPHVPTVAPGERLPLSQLTQRASLKAKLPSVMEEFQQNHWVADEEGIQSWRISARVPAFDNIDYGQFLNRLDGVVQPILDDAESLGATAIYTGSMPVAYEAQRALLGDLFRSFLTAFGLVAVVMIAVLRSVTAGLLAMLPNLFPTVVLFGIRGWTGEPVDIGAVMTASIALGIAVDDTLHFLVWFRRETARGVTPRQAVRHGFMHCGRAMVQTSLICGLGLFVYVASDFGPTRHFSIMMVGLLLMALVGDLVFLPAILLSPVGRAFMGKPISRSTPQSKRSGPFDFACGSQSCVIQSPNQESKL